jgi:hypothetical protein
MKRPLAWLAGALGLAGAYKTLKQHPEPAAGEAPDPRADELRRRIEEAKPLVEEHEQEVFESGEQPVDEADPEAKRRSVHERARAAADEMRGESDRG